MLLPETVGALWKRLFAHPTIVELKASLFFQPQIVVTNVSLQQQTGPRHIPLHPKEIRHRFLVSIADLDRAAIQSLAYARSISPHVVAVHVALDQQDAEAICVRWHQFQEHFSEEERVRLVVIASPYRSLVRPLLAYIDTIQAIHSEETLTVLLPELVVAHWWEQPLPNQTALCLKAALLARPGMVVTDIPQHLHPRG